MQPLPDDDFFAERGDRSAESGSRDARLVLAAVLELTDDKRTRHEPVRVSAQNDVLILTGTVASGVVRDAAAAVARRTPGVRDLCNALRVANDTSGEPNIDQFDGLVAPIAGAPATRVAVSRASRSRLRRSAVLATAAVWCVLPVATIGVHLPTVPVLSVALAVTLAVVLPRRSLRRRIMPSPPAP